MLVATSIIVVFPLTAPRAKAVVHLESADAEDGVSPYDIDGLKNGIVMWDPNLDHNISQLNGYTIEAHMTLNIPKDVEINFSGFSSRQIDVYGTLITELVGPKPIFTTFMGDGGWEGIFFHSGSKGRIVNTVIKGALAGVVFEPGSELLSPGISLSSFEDIGHYGLRLDGVSGSTSIYMTMFDDSDNPSAYSLVEVANGNLNIDNVFVFSHGPGNIGLNISNASVYATQSSTNGNDQLGNTVHIGAGSNETVLDHMTFLHGGLGDHFIRVDGSSNLINNCRITTANGTRSIIANDDASGIPAHPVLLNPVGTTAPGSWHDSFDNSTMNATGSSSVTLQWYMDVQVVDPNGNPIINAPVWVKDRLGNPALPDSMITDDGGWAKGFTVTELIVYENSITSFDPFNVSALNNSVMGYANPLMNYSKVVTVVVPFSMVQNTPPNVSWLPTPQGVQQGYIPFDFILEDPDLGDDGNMSILVDYSTDGITWQPAISAPGSDLNHLNNNTLYTFIWDSSLNLGNNYFPTVYIRITPRDRAGNGTPRQTGSFQVENKAPIVSWLPTPSGVQSDLITIDFKLEDPNPEDNGRMSITVEYSTDGVSWQPASSGPGSDLNGLNNDTLYHFIWASYPNIPNTYSTMVYIRITPRDRAGDGPSRQTGNFTVDNKAPSLLTFPTVTVTNTSAIIEWTVDEPADASVRFGPYFSGPPVDLIFETTGSTGSMQQSVTLTGLKPGRYYSFIIISTDIYGNKFSSSIDDVFSFETEVHIQLFKGWNMISIPPNLLDSSPEDVLFSISGEYVVVQTYFASDPVDPWKHYRPDKLFGNDLLWMDYLQGYLILMKNDAVLIPNHNDPTLDPLFNGTFVGLEPGWNLIGYPSVHTRSIDDALAGVPYDMVQTYDAASGQWLSYDGTSGDLTQMEMGRGYWIHCTSSYDWQVEYDE
jgi:hypothetical protein